MNYFFIRHKIRSFDSWQEIIVKRIINKALTQMIIRLNNSHKKVLCFSDEEKEKLNCFATELFGFNFIKKLFNNVQSNSYFS